MKSYSIYFGLLLIASLLIFNSCKDDDIVIPEDFWTCHDEKDWTESKVFDDVVGDWDLLFYMGPWGSTGGRILVDSLNVSVHFASDSTLTIDRNGVKETATWEIELGALDHFAIKTEPFINEIYGLVLLCKDWMEFNDGYIDGANHTFIKQD